jgi:hypothetical protein
MKRLSSILFIVYALVACRPGIPSDVLSEGDMVDILYDIHIAQAMAETHEGLKDGKDVVALRSAVLKKYDVTPEEYERSYLFYCSNAEYLQEIYNDLSDRIRDNVLAAGGKIQGIETEEADSANVWNQVPYIILMDNTPYNKMSFSVSPDSTFRNDDRINLQYDAQTIVQDGSCDVVACMNVFYGDSIVTQTTHITSNGSAVLTVSGKSDQRKISKINGFFILSPNTSSQEGAMPFRLVVLSRIKLLHLNNNINKQNEQGTGIASQEESSADQE